MPASDLALKSPGASAFVFSREASFHAIKELTRLLNNEAQSRERDRKRGGKEKRQEEKERPHGGAQHEHKLISYLPAGLDLAECSQMCVLSDAI